MYPDPGPQQPSTRLSGVAIVIGVLAIVIVLGVVAGVVVWVVRGGPGADPPPQPPTPPPSSTQPTPAESSPVTSTPPSETTRPSPEQGPAVTAANLPTSGDLVWPGQQWRVKDNLAELPAEPAAPCQTWTPAGPPAAGSGMGRTFELKPGPGRGVAYVLSYPSEADARAAADMIMADAEQCGQRLSGEQSEVQTLNSPLGQGRYLDLTWRTGDVDHVGTWGVATRGERLVWLWLEADGPAPEWVGTEDGHPMAASLANALSRLRH
ncbi:hypothetical protein ACQBAU_12290 [Propionibacteriaceae bacterium Y2011]|uniref:hypothetical protein n=1 Tax=Microlunatus sp. Y2014 TaxID=3418488 RepID=UPI003B48BC09